MGCAMTYIKYKLLHWAAGVLTLLVYVLLLRFAPGVLNFLFDLASPIAGKLADILFWFLPAFAQDVRSFLGWLARGVIFFARATGPGAEAVFRSLGAEGAVVSSVAIMLWVGLFVYIGRLREHRELRKWRARERIEPHFN